MDIRTGWVSPPSLAGGLDHLGIQQLPARIFSNLLPGITVVTDRVANYSFYPWVSWIHHEHSGTIGLDFVHFLRRAECLITLLAERHTIARQEDERFHSRGLVGRLSLTKLLRAGEARPIEFGSVAALRASDDDRTYFKNRYGGLGQYYLGPLRDLGVLHRIGDRVEVSEDIGLPLAKAFDERVDGAAFLRILKRGDANDEDLDALSSFCPCQLAGNTNERELLLDLLLARQEGAAAPDILRRQTLLLLLELAERQGTQGRVPLDDAFKAACLTGALESGDRWTVPEPWQRVVNAWATYERNDLLSIAALGVFWVALRKMDLNGGGAAQSREVGGWVAGAAEEALGDLASKTLEAGVRDIAEQLPPLAMWTHDAHEFQVGYEVRRAARSDDEAGCLRASATVLLALAARHLHPHAYAEAGVPADYLLDYPLNLNSFAASVRGEWSRLSVARWLGELAAAWGIEAHLRVALRKLHHESKDTFLVRMTDEGLLRPPDAKEPPLPSFTASRLNRAVQFAVDLGLASWEVAGSTQAERGGMEGDQEEEGGWVARITDRGRTVLGQLRG
jgi:hypothetical protein